MMRVRVTRSSLHAADEAAPATWEIDDDDRLSDLAVLAVETRFLPRQAAWHLFRGRRVVLRVAFGPAGDPEVSTWRRGDSLVVRLFHGASDLLWDHHPFTRRSPHREVPRWWQRPRLRVDAAATTRARAALAAATDAPPPAN